MKEKQPPKPAAQPDPYSRFQTLQLILPAQFVLLCKLVRVPPRRVLMHFMINTGREHYAGWDDRTRMYVMDYFIRCGYGQDHYSQDDLLQLFRELEAIAMLWPHEGDLAQMREYGQWRRKYRQYWFKKWQARGRQGS